ncbi:MAG: DNA polymerase I [Clostridiales bacterium]|jgi:DNA polymerase-1|nr:DNA polymerase I [Eubacteriales bacterium]MDH7565298.1 DNA polymerase I [Clostridiales bacterium]
MGTEKIMIIDGNSILNRAFYGLQGPKLLSTSDGLYTNAVFGFLNILHKYLEEEKPGYICVAFDLKAPTFRHREFEAYKAKRKGMPEELAVQVPIIKQVLDAMKIKRLEYEGYEADDIIGHISLCAENRGMETIILTGDRDSLQLASSTTRIKIPTTRGGRTETEEYDYNKVLEKYGVTPTQFIDVKGLMGDPSDNIPGVPGIGEKTALDLIRKFGSIENLYDCIEQVDKKSVKDKLLNGRDMAFMSKRLATISRDNLKLCGIEEFKRADVDQEKLYQLFMRLEFKSLVEKFGLKEAPAVGAGNSRRAKEAELISNLEDLARVRNEIQRSKEVSIYYLMDKLGNFTTRLAGIAFTWSEDRSAYFNVGAPMGEEELLKELGALFQDETIKIIGHDIKNLIVYLKNKGISLKGLSSDTMIAAYILDPSRETYSVAELAEEHMGMRIEPIEHLAGKGKNHTLYMDMPVDKLSSVAVTHSEAIFRVRGILEQKIKENNQWDLYCKIELPLVEVLADMEFWGFKVDVEELRRFSAELEEKINSLTGKIYELAGSEFNINSTKQLGTILFEELNLPVLKKTKTGYSTDAEVLEQLAPRHEIVSNILEYRQLVKLRSTYAEGLIGVINPATGRIHSSFNQTVTATGRISSTEPNLQNIPIKLEMGRKIRRLFVPSSTEYLLLDADYSQIELRVLAHITGDENMIAAFINNEDIHTSTASQVFGVPKNEVTALMRSRAKAVNFGIVYGIGDFSLSRDLGITRKEAKKYISEYLNKYPGVKEYMHKIVEEGREKGFVTTLFNRRRYLPELRSNNFNTRSFGERIAMNTPIQGSAADIIKIAMVNVYRELQEKKLRSRLILQVHDELIIETYIEEKDEVAEILKRGMESAAALRVPLRADVKAGRTWYETK